MLHFLVFFLRKTLPEDGIVFYLAIWEVSGKGNALQFLFWDLY